MNRIAGMALMAAGLVLLGQGASANGNCTDAKGKLVEFWDGGSESPGRLSMGGWLNGATLAVFNSDGYPTPVPTAFSYTAAFTLATRHGHLKGTRLFVTDSGAGWSIDMTNIDPDASTGIFAGATGVVYVNQTTRNTAPPPTTYQSEVRAVICFRTRGDPRDR